MGLGGTQGNGRQFVSWIHEADFARAVEFLIEHEELEGKVNIAAPNPLPNREFMALLRDAWERPNGVPAPAFLIEIGAFFLRTESELVLKSRRVVPGRLLDAGFQFEFSEWAQAAEDLVRLWRENR
jgi:NAD dependent epimerase/dehydratase family enzyme